MIFRMTPHARQDRIERLKYIVTEIGLGEKIVCSNSRNEGTRKEIMTDTGVLLVLSNENLVITAYVVNISQAIAIWREFSNSSVKMPSELYNTILRNQFHYEKLQQINIEYNYHEGEYRFFNSKKG